MTDKQTDGSAPVTSAGHTEAAVASNATQPPTLPEEEEEDAEESDDFNSGNDSVRYMCTASDRNYSVCRRATLTTTEVTTTRFVTLQATTCDP